MEEDSPKSLAQLEKSVSKIISSSGHLSIHTHTILRNYLNFLYINHVSQLGVLGWCESGETHKLRFLAQKKPSFELLCQFHPL